MIPPKIADKLDGLRIYDASTWTRVDTAAHNARVDALSAALAEAFALPPDLDDTIARAERLARNHTLGSLTGQAPDLLLDLARAVRALAAEAKVAGARRSRRAGTRRRGRLSELRGAAGGSAPRPMPGGETMTDAQRYNRLTSVLQEAMTLLVEMQDESRTKQVRRAIEHLNSILTTPVGGGCICNCPVLDGHTSTCPVIAFLRRDEARR